MKKKSTLSPKFVRAINKVKAKTLVAMRISHRAEDVASELEDAIQDAQEALWDLDQMDDERMPREVAAFFGKVEGPLYDLRQAASDLMDAALGPVDQAEALADIFANKRRTRRKGGGRR